MLLGSHRACFAEMIYPATIDCSRLNLFNFPSSLSVLTAHLLKPQWHLLSLDGSTFWLLPHAGEVLHLSTEALSLSRSTWSRVFPIMGFTCMQGSCRIRIPAVNQLARFRLSSKCLHASNSLVVSLYAPSFSLGSNSFMLFYQCQEVAWHVFYIYVAESVSNIWSYIPIDPRVFKTSIWEWPWASRSNREAGLPLRKPG